MSEYTVAWDWTPESLAQFHRDRAANSSPFWQCRACGIERREHGWDGHAIGEHGLPTHWFVPPRPSTPASQRTE